MTEKTRNFLISPASEVMKNKQTSPGDRLLHWE